MMCGWRGYSAHVMRSPNAYGTTAASNSVRALREHAERQARARLGTDRWARAYAVGRSASIDSLLNDIERTPT